MSRHMNRLTAPRAWPVKRKAAVWVTKQSPAHIRRSAACLRSGPEDMLGCAHSRVSEEDSREQGHPGGRQGPEGR